MPQFVAQILSLDGDVILSNVDVSIDFSQQGRAWRGNFDLPPTATFDPNSLPQRTIELFLNRKEPSSTAQHRYQ